jgi:hypothetical protein
MASRRNQNAALLFQEHPVLTLDLWERQLGGPNSRARAVEQAKSYAEVGRLRRLARGLYAVTPIGTDPTHILSPRRYDPMPFCLITVPWTCSDTRTASFTSSPTSRRTRGARCASTEWSGPRFRIRPH